MIAAARLFAPLDENSSEQSPTEPDELPEQASVGGNGSQDTEPRPGRINTLVLLGVPAALFAAFGIGYLILNVEYDPSAPEFETIKKPTTTEQFTVDKDAATTSLPLPELVPISPGCFIMGSPTEESVRSPNEGPQHRVCLQGFEIARYEVTFDQYDAFANATNRRLPDDEGWGRGSHPLINVDWNEAQAYTQWLSTQIDKTCGLPSETQWEYAARAGTTTSYALPAPDGSDDIEGKGLANCGSCGSEWDYKQTAPVGSFEPNGWDLYDMHGNVWEWTADYWHANYEKAPTDGSAWMAGGDSSIRVLRGGSWFNVPDFARSAYRDGVNPGKRYDSVGFRVLCSGPL